MHLEPKRLVKKAHGSWLKLLALGRTDVEPLFIDVTAPMDPSWEISHGFKVTIPTLNQASRCSDETGIGYILKNQLPRIRFILKMNFFLTVNNEEVQTKPLITILHLVLAHYGLNKHYWGKKTCHPARQCVFIYGNNGDLSQRNMALDTQIANVSRTNC